MNKNLRKFCVAPMMGYTTPHARKLYRILSKNIFLFTEMVPAKTLIYKKNIHQTIENNNQNPIALQIGGSDMRDLILCTKIAESLNFNEINLNVGCPSKAVQKGKFGACLMKEKKLVRECLDAMINKANIEVTMKCRIGLNKNNSYDFFKDFIYEISKSGIRIVYVHARNAFLNGVSPKNNRNIPPLNYNFVSSIKRDFPNMQFILNGGIDSLEKAYKYSKNFDGIMVGRLIQSNPFCLAKVDEIFFENTEQKKVKKIIINEYFEYIKSKLNEDSIFRLLSPLLFIFFAVPNGKKYKREINEKMNNFKIDDLQTMFMKFVQ